MKSQRSSIPSKRSGCTLQRSRPENGFPVPLPRLSPRSGSVYRFRSTVARSLKRRVTHKKPAGGGALRVLKGICQEISR
ncbi:MAG: hypothetical protein ISR41_04180 [Puniceicoccaceae bacterium]|nr:hypothetical protein [Puniceicoccaceae bacterium]